MDNRLRRSFELNKLQNEIIEKATRNEDPADCFNKHSYLSKTITSHCWVCGHKKGRKSTLR